MSGGIALDKRGSRHRFVPGIHSTVITMIGRRLPGAASRALMMLSAGPAGPSSYGRLSLPPCWMCWSVRSVGFAV
ncbi:hypothetical protein GCM10009608_36180 [Pseudonocardia alaniniphila]